jgi:hypothetical protein
MILFPIFVPWFLIGLVVSSSSSSQNEDAAAADLYLRPFSLELHDFSKTGRGVRTLVDRSAGDILLEVPVEDTISLSKLKDRLTTPSDHTLTEEQLLALGLLLLRKEDHHPYVSDMLPKKHYSLWTMPSDLWDDTAPFLPKCYRESFQATRQMVLDFCHSAKDVYPSDEDEDALWAFSMVRSRFMAVPELQQDDDADNPMPLGLIPGLDLFNHAFDAGMILQLVDNQWMVTSSHSYKAGDQIFLSYGDDKDNWKLLLTYGFSLAKNKNNNNNPNVLAFWTWEDLLTAAGQVRPAMFSERVRQSLLRHPQLGIYVASTEDRATFSYDLKTQTPRESLQTGLTLLSSLATQLGFPQDEDDDNNNTLAKDVLAQVIKNRLEELKASQTRRSQSSSDDTPAEWKPFLDTLWRTLDEEEAYLRAV